MLYDIYYLLHFQLYIATLCLPIVLFTHCPSWESYYCAMTIISRLFSLAIATARNPRVAGGENEAKLDMRRKFAARFPKLAQRGGIGKSTCLER